MGRNTSLGHGAAQLVAAVGAVGEVDEQEWKHPAGATVEQQRRPVPVLQIARVHRNRQDQAEGVDQQMTLLARVIARRGDAGPPFSAPFTL